MGIGISLTFQKLVLKSIENGVNKLSKVKYFQSDLTAFDNLLKISLAKIY